MQDVLILEFGIATRCAKKKIGQRLTRCCARTRCTRKVFVNFVSVHRLNAASQNSKCAVSAAQRTIAAAHVLGKLGTKNIRTNARVNLSPLNNNNIKKNTRISFILFAKQRTRARARTPA